MRLVPRRGPSRALALWTAFYAVILVIAGTTTLIYASQSPPTTCTACAYAPLLAAFAFGPVWLVGFLILGLRWLLTRHPLPVRTADLGIATLRRLGASAATSRCNFCESRIPAQASECPSCGERQAGS